MARKIYVASSWRNEKQPQIVGWLRSAGHEVYDFRHPAPGNDGFAWSEIDPAWKSWTPQAFEKHALRDPIALKGFGFDMRGLDWADTCVLVLPCGRSAHLEAGYAIGQGKQVLILLDDKGFEPELMYLMATHLVHGPADLLAALNEADMVPLWVRLAGDMALAEPELNLRAQLDAKTAGIADLPTEADHRRLAELVRDLPAISTRNAALAYDQTVMENDEDRRTGDEIEGVPV